MGHNHLVLNRYNVELAKQINLKQFQRLTHLEYPYLLSIVVIETEYTPFTTMLWVKKYIHTKNKNHFEVFKNCSHFGRKSNHPKRSILFCVASANRAIGASVVYVVSRSTSVVSTLSRVLYTTRPYEFQGAPQTVYVGRTKGVDKILQRLMS